MVGPQHIAMARRFMMPSPSTPGAAGVMGRGPAAPRRKSPPGGGAVPVRDRIPLSPNMTSFVQSPQGQAVLQRMMGMVRERVNPGRQNINTIGQV